MNTNIVILSCWALFAAVGELDTAVKKEAPRSVESFAEHVHPNAEQKSWALATTAILTERNEEDHVTLAGAPLNDENIGLWKHALRVGWEIDSKEELLSTLDRLLLSGQQTQNDYDIIRVQIDAMSAEELTSFIADVAESHESLRKIVLVLKYKFDLGKPGVMGWEYSCYITLCRWGYAVGFLTEEEAWQKIMPVALYLQSEFSSWKQLGMSYTIGRELSGNGGITETREAYDHLSSDAESPWKKVDWKMDLNCSQE